jgi:hypothetical protein
VDENSDVEVNIGRCHPEWWLGSVASSLARCRSYQRGEEEDDASLVTVGPARYRIGTREDKLLLLFFSILFSFLFSIFNFEFPT